MRKYIIIDLVLLFIIFISIPIIEYLVFNTLNIAYIYSGLGAISLLSVMVKMLYQEIKAYREMIAYR